MALKSPHYNIDIFNFGYSAFADKRRFTIIDNQLAFLADTTGDGRILGWAVTVSDQAALELSVSSGIGVINRFATRTFGPLAFNIADNQTSFVYMRRKDNVIGGYSDFSGIARLFFQDTVPPAVPSGFSIPDITDTTLHLDWDDNSEADFSKYVIQRSTNNIDFSDHAETSVSSFLDENLQSDTVYYYKIKSVDTSDNASSFTSSIFAKTLKDVSVPINGSFLQSFSGNNLVKLLWEPSSSNNIDCYEIEVQELDTGYETVGNSNVVQIDSSKTFSVVKNLKNNTHYKFLLRTLNKNGVLSDPLEQIDIPSFNPNPNEVDDVTITYKEGATDDVNIIMNVAWSIGFDPYDPYVALPNQFHIILVENGTRVSEPIAVINSFDRDIQLIPFKNAKDEVVFESVKNDTLYLANVQTLDDVQNKSEGVVVRTQAPIFQEVATISSPSVIEQSDLSIFATWINTDSDFFSHNLLTLKRLTADGELEETILENLNIGISNTYLLDNTNWVANKQFWFSVIAVDSSGNDSLPINFSIVTTDVEDVAIPDPPTNPHVLSGNKNVVLTWDESTNIFVTSYRIYRSKRELFLENAEFSLITTLSSAITTFTDFNVDNNTIYAYIITSVDIFGQESPNPIDNTDELFTFLVTVPRPSLFLVPPEDLVAVVSGSNDASLTWTCQATDKSGFEIWKSIGDTTDFKLVGSTGPSTTEFTDSGGLLLNNTEYFYLVRKFINESDVFVAESDVPPQGATILAKVTTLNGAITIDEEPAIELKDLEDPVRAETKKQLAVHKHNLEEDTGIDRRIDLNVDIIVKDDDWSTGDFQRYETDIDISGSSNFRLIVSGDVNEAFFTREDGIVNEVALAQIRSGLLPLLYEVQSDSGIITFEVPLFSEDDSIVTPFTEPPSLSLSLLGVGEIDSTLVAEKLENISATQVVSGQLADVQMPSIAHEGRLNEHLIPDQIATSSEDNFIYTVTGSEETLNDAIAFYDFVNFRDDELLAATSNGLLWSDDFGVSWTIRLNTATAPLRVFSASQMGKHFVITNDEIFANDGTSSVAWSKISGIENVKVIRDIVEDASGNLFISTDLGVFKLNRSRSSNFFVWEQTPLFGPRSTEAYALLYDAINKRLLVSNELGLLQSTNEGVTWDFTDEFNETKKIFQFVEHDDSIFALTKDEIWRKRAGNFLKVGELDVSFSRKMAVFNDRLYMTTTEGLFGSNRLADIVANDDIAMERVLPELNIKNQDTLVHGLSIISDDFLFIGTDKRVHMLDTNNDISLRFDQVVGTIPSVYVDKGLQKIGFRYNNAEGRKNISFDEKLKFSSIVTVANQYKTFKAENSGWSVQKFDAPIELRANGLLTAKSGLIELDVNEFSNFIFPVATEINSHLPGAEKYQDVAQADIDKLVSTLNEDTELAEDESLVGLLTNVMVSVERFSSQLFPEARIITVGDADVAFTSPAINTDLFVINPDGTLGDKIGTVNITSGAVTFDSSFNKFDFLEIDVLDATVKNIGEFSHREIEDEFELINSGLPSALSQVQQSNVVKLGVFNEKKYAGEQNELSTPFQATYIVPRNMSFYDSLNSDIDFSIAVEHSVINNTFPRAADTLFVSETNKVLVGGSGGLISINVADLDIDFVTLDTGTPFVKQLVSRFGVIYAVTDKNLFSSSDNGATWTKLDRIGLPNKLFSFSIINNNLVIGASDGIYFKSEFEDSWRKAVDSNNPVAVMFDPDLLFALVDGDIYSSGDGSAFAKLASFNLTGLEVNELIKFKSMIFTATNKGLYSDSGSFYSTVPTFKLEDVLDDLDLSKDIAVNDLHIDGDRLLVALGDGRYAVLTDETYAVFSDSNLDTVHRIINVNGDIWLFGYDQFKVPSLNHTVRLSTGAPV